MNKKPQDDLRYKKTERLIQQTFRELLKEKEYSQISVQELARQAEINRKTFYLHYSSMDELLLKMQFDVLNRFLTPIKDTKLPDDLEKVVRICYEFAESADALDEKILNSKGCLPVENPYTENSTVICFNEERLSYRSGETPFLTAYINGCMTEIYRAWVKNGRKEPMEDIIRLTIRLIRHGLEG
ncbi:MAG: TetR family transcriptional regulator [Bacteroidales bacterium]|nr:TetR family transcriptional regulator [Lachnoclostridium sp.]MCM1383362.1 TetR family transcriptional regulator [Lachnoclostridium sp.]MCM1465027.1 TetR family transcriptional regulator [Bacteroidales bacterium]